MTNPARSFWLALGLLAAALPSVAGNALDISRPDVDEFIRRMEATHGLPATETREILSGAEIRPPILEAMRRPAEKVKPWFEYREIFLTDRRIAEGVAFWDNYRDTLERISADTGVPVEIIVGILGVETFYGRITGRHRVIDALATLAFEYPPRSRFFASELEQFLLLIREQRIDPATATGSYAGAMGGPQFIASSYRAYAVDGSGDGRVDLWSDWADIVGSVANYLSAHGWQPGNRIVTPVDEPPPELALSDGLALDRVASQALGEGQANDADEPVMIFALDGSDGPLYWVGHKNFYVITRYNRSNMYAMAVYQLGQAVRARREARDAAG